MGGSGSVIENGCEWAKMGESELRVEHEGEWVHCRKSKTLRTNSDATDLLSK